MSKHIGPLHQLQVDTVSDTVMVAAMPRVNSLTLASTFCATCLLLPAGDTNWLHYADWVFTTPLLLVRSYLFESTSITAASGL